MINKRTTSKICAWNNFHHHHSQHTKPHRHINLSQRVELGDHSLLALPHTKAHTHTPFTSPLAMTSGDHIYRNWTTTSQIEGRKSQRRKEFPNDRWEIVIKYWKLSRCHHLPILALVSQCELLRKRTLGRRRDDSSLEKHQGFRKMMSRHWHIQSSQEKSVYLPNPPVKKISIHKHTDTQCPVPF